MRYDPEYALALAIKSYLAGKLDEADFAQWPIVTWFDPMAIDDGNRVACIATEARSMSTSQGNFIAQIEVGVKTNWTEQGADSEVGLHFDRVNQVRDVLNQDQDALLAELSTHCPDGFAIGYVDKERQYASEVNEGNFYSSITLTVKCHATA